MSEGRPLSAFLRHRYFKVSFTSLQEGSLKITVENRLCLLVLLLLAFPFRYVVEFAIATDVSDSASASIPDFFFADAERDLVSKMQPEGSETELLEVKLEGRYGAVGGRCLLFDFTVFSASLVIMSNKVLVELAGLSFCLIIFRT